MRLIQNQSKNNIKTASQKVYKKRINQPADAKAIDVAHIVYPNRIAFANAIRYIAAGKRKYTAKADSNKGKKISTKRPTIDTRLNTPMRIKAK